MVKTRPTNLDDPAAERPDVRVLLLLVALLSAGCAGPAAERLTEGVGPDTPDEPYAPGWPDPDAALLRPGVLIRTPERDCPSTFLFARPDNGTLFLATTSYCARGLPVGTVGTVGDSEHLVVLAYSSFITMSEVGERDTEALEYNDFAVFYVDSGARADAHPALLGRAGPVGLVPGDGFGLGDRLVVHEPTSSVSPALAGGWRDTTVTGRVGAWALLVHGAPPTLPGSTGGAVLTPEGEAVGVLVNLGVNPNPGANGVARLDTMLAYAAKHANLDIVLATWGSE